MKLPVILIRILSDFKVIFWWAKNFSIPRFLYVLTVHLQLHLARIIQHLKTPALSFNDLKSKKSGDRVFILGAGPSLNNISNEEWRLIGLSNTIGFNSVFYLKKIDITFFILKEWGSKDSMIDRWRVPLSDLIGKIKENKFLRNTVFLLQSGLTSIFSNRLLVNGLWPPELRYSTYWIDRITLTPNRDFRGRLVHRQGTLCSAISFAVQMGYKEIVLAGVDLDGRGYFWSPPGRSVNWSVDTGEIIYDCNDELGGRVEDRHNTANNGIVETISDWAAFLNVEYGVKLFTYNPRSLLCEALPVYHFSEGV